MSIRLTVISLKLSNGLDNLCDYNYGIGYIGDYKSLGLLEGHYEHLNEFKWVKVDCEFHYRECYLLSLITKGSNYGPNYQEIQFIVNWFNNENETFAVSRSSTADITYRLVDKIIVEFGDQPDESIAPSLYIRLHFRQLGTGINYGTPNIKLRTENRWAVPIRGLKIVDDAFINSLKRCSEYDVLTNKLTTRPKI